MQYNNLSQAATPSINPLVHQTGFESPPEFNHAILEAANNAGCEFLFEIPGDLFGFEETRAAAIKLNAFSEDDQLAFILCNADTGTIHVLSNDEVPSKVIRFVESYAAVLSLLQNSKITSH